MTKISSRGQIVIPEELRKDIKEGDKLIVIKNKNQIILEKTSDIGKKFEEDLEFAKRTEEALKKIDSGKGIRMDFDSFIKEMEKW